jgi:chromosome segregation ATPase
MSLRKNVKIDIDLEADTKNALTKISGALGTIRAQANTNNFGDSFDKDQDLQIGGRVNSTSIRMAALSALHQADKHIGELRDPKITIRGEVDMDADKLKEDVAEEEEALNAIKDGANAATEAKERFAKENGNVRDRALASVTALDKEESSFDDIIKKGDSLTKIKQRVAGANKHVAKMSEESADELFGEESRARELAESMRIVEDSSDGLTDSMGATTRQLRKMRNRTDRTSNSMRAAAQVGEIFEDGLGSLSVNLGAFTVALRNFLTQVPLLLTALGSAGAAATGAWGSCSCWCCFRSTTLKRRVC